MSGVRLEVLVEPFKENDPGPHVHAVIASMESSGLDVDMGPFATTAEASTDAAADAVRDLLRAGFAAGATNIHVRVEAVDGD